MIKNLEFFNCLSVCISLCVLKVMDFILIIFIFRDHCGISNPNQIADYLA